MRDLYALFAESSLDLFGVIGSYLLFAVLSFIGVCLAGWWGFALSGGRMRKS